MAGQRYSGKRSNPQGGYSESGRHKRRNPGDNREVPLFIDPKDTVYRYLCPVKHIGTILGKGGEIVKQLRVDTKAKIKISETVPGCEERVVTICSSSSETNHSEFTGDMVSPAQDALFSIHERVIADGLHGDDDSDKGNQVTARLLVPSDQIGCIIGKGGQIVQNIRSETGAQIRILKDDHLPRCALSSDELVQISGEAYVVKKALFTIASRLHDNPSRSQHLFASANSNAYLPVAPMIAPPVGAPVVGLAPTMGSYGAFKADAVDWTHSLYSTPRIEASSKEFSLRLVCPTKNIGGVIGKGGGLINQVRQETGAAIKVDSSAAEGDDCMIIVSSNEFFDNGYSPTIEAAALLQPRCSEKVERDSGTISYTTRLLVPNSRIGCLIGKGGTIITELRKLTKANIRIISKDSKDSLPKIASADDEMVQISGEIDVARNALLQVATRLKANLFDREGALSTPLPLPYLPVPAAGADRLNYDSRDNYRYGGGETYPTGYAGSSDLARPLPIDRPNYDSRESKRYGRGGTYSSGYGGSNDLGLPLPADAADRLNYDSKDSKRYGRGGTYSSTFGGSSDLAPPLLTNGADRLNYDSRQSKRYGRGETYSSGYGGSSNLAGSYSGYPASQVVDSRSGYEAYGSYPSGRNSSSGFSSQNPDPRRRSYDY